MRSTSKGVLSCPISTGALPIKAPATHPLLLSRSSSKHTHTQSVSKSFQLDKEIRAPHWKHFNQRLWPRYRRLSTGFGVKGVRHWWFHAHNKNLFISRRMCQLTRWVSSSRCSSSFPCETVNVTHGMWSWEKGQRISAKEETVISLNPNLGK